MKTKKIIDIIKTSILMLVVLTAFTACTEDDNTPGDDKSVVGKWQKYEVLDDDGNFTEGDPDEFWIFNTDGSFINEDGGSVTATGYYNVEGSRLTIYSHSVDDPDEEENYSGDYLIDNIYMTYTFTDLADGEKSTIRFKKF